MIKSGKKCTGAEQKKLFCRKKVNLVELHKHNTPFFKIINAPAWQSASARGIAACFRSCWLTSRAVQDAFLPSQQMQLLQLR